MANLPYTLQPALNAQIDTAGETLACGGCGEIVDVGGGGDIGAGAGDIGVTQR